MAVLLFACPRVGQACVGLDCLNVYSTEEGGGALTVQWDFANRKVQTFETLCASGMCLYTAIDPGFRPGSDPSEGLHVLEDGTRVSFEAIATDAAVTVRLNGETVEPGNPGFIGTAPDFHNHPSWQLRVAEGEHRDYPLTFMVTTDSATYADSQPFTLLVTNLPPAEMTATPTPTPTPTVPIDGCPGDCNGDGTVRVDELVGGVSAVLGRGDVCPALDLDGNGTAVVNEVVTAVNAALRGCAATPTPTVTQAATFDVVQQTIFSPRCAIPTCHDSRTRSGDLILEPGQSYPQLVGVEPDIESAADAGLLRVDPGDADNSFILIKLEGPPPVYGSRMPLTGALLSDAEVDLIRRWIVAGAPQ
jgi:hypothetical protein